MEIVLINEPLFKANSPITDDTNIAKFVPYVNIAQKVYLEPILGKALTDELKVQVSAANTVPPPVNNPITPENQALLEILAAPLSMYAVYQGLPFHWASIVNKGVTIRESENSKGVDIKDVAQMRRWIKDDADIMLRQLIAYLRECRASYPLWAPSPECSCDEGGNGGSMKTPLDAGIYIPKY